ncbi:MAG: ATP-binding cassette domain-containing protein [Nitrososphaerota archaeon]
MHIIEIENLSFRYAMSDRKILDNINMVVNEGEFVLLIGPSGCGKTTLCKCLNGLIPHFHQGILEGKVIVNNYNVAETPPYILASTIGMVFQNPENQLFSLSVENDIAFALENLGYARDEIKERVDFALKAVGIEDLRNRSPFELSGGQQQKVAIASILALRPKIIVLDEPTSFLDPLSAKNIIDLISELKNKLNITIILVEHRLDLAIRNATRIILMDNGKIVLDDEPRKIFSRIETEVLGVATPKIIRIAKSINKKYQIFNELPLTIEEFSSILRRNLIDRSK